MTLLLRMAGAIDKPAGQPGRRNEAQRLLPDEQRYVAANGELRLSASPPLAL